MKPQRVLIALLLAGFGTSAAADPLAAGRQVVLHGGSAGTTPCAACHGAEGSGDAAAGFPRLAGQNAAYLTKQINDIRSGNRASPIMRAAVRGLTAQEIQAVAAYYAAQRPAPDKHAEGAIDGAGEQLARHGDPASQVPACDSCHGPDGRGVAPTFPALAGQHPGYLLAQLEAFHRGDRHNDAGGIMAAVAKKLNEAQMGAVANYFANLKTAP